MAINRTGISSLNTGAGEITYSGNEGPKSPDQQLMAQADPMLVDEYKKYVFEMEEQGMQPISFKEFIQQAMQGMAYGGSAKPTYTQSRKQQLAGGGVAGLKNRPGYFLGDLVDKIKDDIIPNEIKENPVLTAAVLGGAANQWDLIPGDMSSQNWIGELLGKIPGTGGTVDTVLGKGGTGQTVGSAIGNVGTSIGNIFSGGDPTKQAENQVVSSIVNSLFPQTQGTNQSGIVNALLGNTLGTNLSSLFMADQETGGIPFGMNWANLPEGLKPYLRKEIKSAGPAQDTYSPSGHSIGGVEQYIKTGTTPGTPAEYEQKINPVYPISMGLAAGEYARRNPGPTLPADTARDASRIDLASAIGGDNLRFKLDPSVAAAQGGRIGYTGGGPTGHSPSHWNSIIEAWDAYDGPMNFPEFYHSHINKAQGGRIGAQEGGLMDLGGMEKDYRNEGGFVPIGGQERADDVPARLSKNEFVFTADAVRSAGGGDIDKGAEVMENVMNNLEQGGQISQESQGLEGARNMFATAQRLEGVM